MKQLLGYGLMRLALPTPMPIPYLLKIPAEASKFKGSGDLAWQTESPLRGGKTKDKSSFRLTVVVGVITTNLCDCAGGLVPPVLKSVGGIQLI